MRGNSWVFLKKIEVRDEEKKDTKRWSGERIFKLERQSGKTHVLVCSTAIYHFLLTPAPLRKEERNRRGNLIMVETLLAEKLPAKASSGIAIRWGLSFPEVWKSQAAAGSKLWKTQPSTKVIDMPRFWPS